MKITNAVWEKRNLGVTTCEVTFDEHDSTENIVAPCDELLSQYDYRVFRVPAGRCDISLFLQSRGCRFMETAITLQNEFLVQYAGIACAKAQRFACRLLNVSSNNLPVIKINMELGAKIKNLEYVLVKHQT